MGREEKKEKSRVRKGGRDRERKGRRKGGGREKGREEGSERGKEERERLRDTCFFASQEHEMNRGVCIYLNHGLQGFNGLRKAKKFCLFQNTYKTQNTMSFYVTQEDPNLLPRTHLENWPENKTLAVCSTSIS